MILRVMILTCWFLPKKNPRAFRVAELLNELLLRGHEVDIFFSEEAEYSPLMVKKMKEEKLHCYKVPVWKKEEYRCEREKRSIVFVEKTKEQLKKILRYLVGGGLRDLVYGVRLLHAVYEKAKKENYDMVIAVSYPFYDLLAASVFFSVNGSVGVKVADCSDPVYYNKVYKKAIYFKFLERFILRKFDFVSIPLKEARLGYRHCDIDERIRVIPQGFRLIEIEKSKYIGNDIPTFCFAGVFYESVRNPEYFFEYLRQLQDSFCFVIYALNDPYTQEILQHYKQVLKNKILIKPPIDRESLIHEMAKMDFVINFDNDNATQRPSKLIDYAMSRRPILSFNRQTFRPEAFQAFLKGDYREQYHVDLAQYDIRRVVDQFEALVDEKIRGDVE